MALHQALVAHTVGAECRVHPHAALSLLQEDGEDEAPVEERGSGDDVDGLEDLVSLLWAVIWNSPVVVAAGIHHYSIVELLPVVELVRDHSGWEGDGMFVPGLTLTCMISTPRALASLVEESRFPCRDYMACSPQFQYLHPGGY